jgi:hypothetical protein
MKDKFDKIIKKAIELYCISEEDEMIYGHSFIEIGERSLSIVKPTDVSLNETINVKPYGKSILDRRKR